MRKTKKIVITIVIAVFAFLAIPVTLLIVGFASPSQYALTYYGALGKMYEKLKNSDGEKIVVIGTSSVPFGVDSELLEKELAAAGENREVVNFGLYGALGIKVMLDLSLDYIGEGDIVIFAPEPDKQAMSLYFSAIDMWYAADSDFSLLDGLAKDNVAEMVGNFPNYVAQKFSRLMSGSPAEPSGIYASASFDENCDLKNAERDCNIMSGGVDVNAPISFDDGTVSAEFVDYVNAYCVAVAEKGAVMLYSFAPMNEAAFVGDPSEVIEKYYDFVAENFRFDIISDPYDSVMEREWFYDSNFHLNSSGMTVNTVRLADDIKNYLGNTTPSVTELPEMPSLPEKESGEGNNELAELFEYTEDDGGLCITGITDASALPSVVIVPYSYEGKIITSFENYVFAGNTNIKEIVIQDNIEVLKDGSFNGCTSLERIRLERTDPSGLGVGYGLLEGADNCKIAVPEGSLGTYVGNYFWGFYAGRYETYSG